MRALQEKRADALVLAGPDISPKFILSASAMGLTTLLVDNRLRESSFTSVQPQNKEGSQSLTNHLIEVHQHRNIALLRGPSGWASSDERAAGYLAAMHEADLETILIEVNDTTIESGREAVKRTFEHHPEVTAIVTANDAMAIGAMRAARRMGRRTPEDLAVVGFDDISWASYADPPLTTVRIPTVEMGRLAGRLLLELIDGSVSVKSRVRVATEPIIRESCGCNGHVEKKE